MRNELFCRHRRRSERKKYGQTIIERSERWSGALVRRSLDVDNDTSFYFYLNEHRRGEKTKLRAQPPPLLRPSAFFAAAERPSDRTDCPVHT